VKYTGLYIQCIVRNGNPNHEDHAKRPLNIKETNMKAQIWLNKVDWLKLVYSHIVDWAVELDYNIPSIATLAKYTVKFLDCKAYESNYNGEKISAIGTHYGSLKSIKIASQRDHMEIMTTLIHEFAHAVQLFSLGENFHLKYKIESSSKDHCENKFENEARALEARLTRWHTRSSLFKEDIDNFIFEFEKPKPKPVPKPEPPVKRETPMEFGYFNYGSYEYEYFETPFTTNWWNRRAHERWGSSNGLKRRAYKSKKRR
jgi:hypothetical protein